jgi:hypothetical protein
MADPVDRALLDVRERGAEELGDLHPKRLGLGAEHGQYGPLDGGRLFGAELPPCESGQLDAEEGVGIVDCLRDRVWSLLLERGVAGCPVEAACAAHDECERAAVVAIFIGLEGGCGLLEECLASGHREQR